MKYYIELTCIDNPDAAISELWSKLYTQLHLAFVEQKDTQEEVPYGISFPQYRLNKQKRIGFLGSKLRIFADSIAELEKLNLGQWLDRLIDYVHITSPREVPQNRITGYANYFRINPKASVEQRILHQAQRRNISIDEATAHFKNFIEQPNFAPYINLDSLSQNIKFRLYIGKSHVDEASDGNFGTYGLSRTVTVPEF